MRSNNTITYSVTQLKKINQVSRSQRSHTYDWQIRVPTPEHVSIILCDFIVLVFKDKHLNFQHNIHIFYVASIYKISFGIDALLHLHSGTHNSKREIWPCTSQLDVYVVNSNVYI